MPDREIEAARRVYRLDHYGGAARRVLTRGACYFTGELNFNAAVREAVLSWVLGACRKRSSSV